MPPSSPGWRRGSAVPRAAAWAPVLLNVVWAIDCIALGRDAGRRPGRC
jgi:hypothetical protein